MANIELNQIITRTNEDNTTFFEVWIEYPFTDYEKLSNGIVSIIPMFSNDKAELQNKISNAYATRRKLAERREQLSSFARWGKAIYIEHLNDFSMLLSDSFNFDSVKPIKYYRQQS